MIWNCSNEWCLANLHFKRIKIQTQQNDFLSSYNNRAYLSLSPFWACHRIQKSHKIENFSHTFSTVCSISTEIQLEGYKRQYFQKTDIGLESFISPSCTCSSFSGSKKDVQKIKMASKSGDFIFKNWPSQRKMDFRKNFFGFSVWTTVVFIYLRFGLSSTILFLWNEWKFENESKQTIELGSFYVLFGAINIFW